MRRYFLNGLLSAVAIGSLIAGAARAQDPPDILDHYRILPRASVLHQSGGIAGVDLRYRVMGKYDLVHGVGWEARAKFANAEVWASQISHDPVPAIVLDVDQIFNLEGLHGKALPVGAPFDVYEFRGKTSDDSTVHLLGAVIGSWMYLRGGTTPPPGSADYFTYRIHTLARSRPFADLNGDGSVNAADWVMLRDGGTGLDDITAGASLADWREQFGEIVPDMAAMDVALSAAMGSGASAAVPEPAGLGLMFITVAVMSAYRRQRKTQ